MLLLGATYKYSMIHIPATCVDNFYTEPDRVREFALKQIFHPSTGTWPGSRTACLSQIDPNFFQSFCNKVFSVFANPNDIKKYYIVSSFQLIDKFDNDPNSPKNKGWIHYDQDCLFAGIIYLTPGADLNSGTSIFKLVNDSTLDNDSYCKQDFYLGKDIPGNYDETLLKHNGSYVETIRFNNLYNRLICFDSSQPHGVNTFYTSGDPRLTQVFFVHELESNIESPISRHQKFL